MKTTEITPERSRSSGWPTTSLLVAATIVLLFSGCAFLPNLSENETSVDAGVDLLNKYVWRGMVLSDVPVAQPSISVANSGFGINVWGNIDLDKRADGRDNAKQFNEIDYTLTYEHQFDALSVTGGVIHYTFPNVGLPTAGVKPGNTLKDGDTTEVFAGLSLPDVIFCPAVTAYVDADEVAGGSYINFSLSHSIDLPIAEGCPLDTADFGVGVGWGSSEYNRAYFADNPNPGSGLNDVTASVSFPIDVGAGGESGWILTPTLIYTSILDTDLRHSHGEEDGSLIWGVNLGIPF